MRLVSAACCAVLAITVALEATRQSSPACSSSAECMELTRAAIAREDYETAHTLAWRAMQHAPRNDVNVMYLLARTQSLSGRPHDALVMLRRLAALQFDARDVDTSDDFRRVRALPEWAGTSATSTPSPASPTSPNAVAAPSAAVLKRGDTGLAVPASVIAPIALAYDGVSRRFVIADDSSDTLKIVDELAGNVVNLVSAGWSNGYRTTALAIDTRRGDLWAAGAHVASNGIVQSAVHKLQLVSGRLLHTAPLPAAAGPVRIVDIAVGRNSVIALDALGRRIFAVGSRTPSARMTIKIDTEPTSLALADDTTSYVAHGTGLVRLDTSARTTTPVTAAGTLSVAGLQSLAWHNGSLFGIQQQADGSRSAVRLRLNDRGTTVVAVDVLDAAATRAAAVYGGTFYWVGPSENDRFVLRRLPAR